MKKIAVIGLGIMGRGIADNYLKNGYEVYVWNRTPEKASSLVAKGAKLCRSPKEAANQADIIFEVTANDESSREVWMGKNGILENDFSNSLKMGISCATISIEWVDELADNCEQANLEFFDMPMTGGRMGAEAGELILLVGGDKQKFEQLKEDLKAIAKELKYFGTAGAGMRYKLLLNMLQGIHIAGLGEVLRLSKVMGLDEKLVGDALAERPGGTTTNLAWRDYQTEPDPINFSVQWINKDLNYAKQTADGVSHPLLDEVIRQYKNAIDQGFKDSDWTKINKL